MEEEEDDDGIRKNAEKDWRLNRISGTGEQKERRREQNTTPLNSEIF